MGRRLVSALLVATAPAVLASSGCSSADVPPSREPVGIQRQRLGGATKNCQLIGDWDRSVYPRIPTKVPTYSWYRVEGTDLGYPVSDGQRLWFFFGDMFASNPPGQTIHTAPDPLGFTWDLTLPADGCPTMDFEYDTAADAFKPQKLDGSQLYGFEVPSGAVFDADNQRFIAGFMKSGGGPNVFSNVGVLGTSLAAAPTEFTSLPGVMDRLQFLLVAPAIVAASEIANWAQLGVTSRTDKVLLLWGTKQPYRNSAVYLAAAPLASIADPSAWKVLDGTSTWSDPLAASPATVYPPEKVHIDPSNPDAPYLQGVGCVGEFSVNYNPVFRKWMMLYVCGSDAGMFSQGRGTKNGAVYLRTAEKPVGPWSPAMPIFRPKLFGVPTDGDPASFMHVRNPRIYRKPDGTWDPLPEGSDAPGVGNPGDPDAWLPPAPPAPNTPVATACPPTIPTDCPSAWPQDPDDPTVGCCTDPNQCCDGLFEKHVGLKGIGSYGWAGIYASYLIQEYSEALDGSGTTPPTHQRIHYVLSTAQPYTVVLMSAELHDDDIDNDGVLDDEDNCKNVYNPKQENCNLAAELDGIALGRSTKIMGDACDPVPCPTGSADRIVTKHLVAGSCTEDMWEASVCIGRAVRSHIDVSPVGSSPTEEVQQAYDFKQPINIPQPNERMDARFCQKRLPDYNCNDVSKRRDQVLWAYGDATPDDEVLSDQRIWHRVTLNCGARPPYTCPTPFLPRGQEYFLD